MGFWTFAVLLPAPRGVSTGITVISEELQASPSETDGLSGGHAHLASFIPRTSCSASCGYNQFPIRKNGAQKYG
jgi:hypothetical protein